MRKIVIMIVTILMVLFNYFGGLFAQDKTIMKRSVPPANVGEMKGQMELKFDGVDRDPGKVFPKAEPQIRPAEKNIWDYKME